MNLSSLRGHCADFCEDPDQTTFNPAQYLAALNEAQRQFAMDTKALWKDKTWAHAANDADEDLPSDFMWEDWVTYDGVELEPISRHEMNRRSGGRDWTADTATNPTMYIVDPEQAVREIVLYPIPSNAKTLAMRYFPLPVDLAADADIPLNSSALMVQFHMAIAAYAAWLLLLKVPQTPSVVAKRKELVPLYAEAVEKAVNTFGNTVSATIRIRGNCIWG